MDRRFRPDRRESRNLIIGFAAVLVMACLTPDNARSQERRRGGGGGFDPAEMFNRGDANGDGRIDADEVKNSRMLQFMAERNGWDVSRGITRSDFDASMQRAREQVERGGGGFGGGRGGEGGRGFGGGPPGGGPPGGGGFGGDRGSREGGDRGSRDGDDRGSREEGRGERRDWGRGRGGSSESGESEQKQGDAAAASGDQPIKPGRKERPRVTIDLQSDLVPADADRDGQIGLYEWRRLEGRTLAEFQNLDRNGDGFVTPREVLAVRGPEVVAAASVAGQPAAQPGTTAQPAAVAAVAAMATPTGPKADEAMRFFRELDSNRDGQIVVEEWQQSSRIRGMFEQDGISLEKPIPTATFVQHYVRLTSSGG